MAKIYRIPVNFNQSGYVFNGLIETRKAWEAAGGAVIGFLLCRLLPLSGVIAISIYLMVMLIFALIGLRGIQGEPVTSYLFHMWNWLKIRKKPYLYNPNGETYTVSASQVHMDETSMQDMLADAWDSIRSKFESEAPEYIEGKTFVFASDPLTERLKDAQERQNEENEEHEGEDGEQETTADETDAQDDSDALGIGGLIDAIITKEKGDSEDG